MSDYINYIDSHSIKLADVAFEIGDYDLSIKFYSKALSRLRNYQGDRMAPIYLASDLVSKIEKARSNKVAQSNNSLVGMLRFLILKATPKFIAEKQSENTYENTKLQFENWQLSKSSFIKGKQCLKYLYLDKHKKNERTPPSKEKLALFKKGHSFEEDFRKSKFPQGINIKEKLGFNFGYFASYTSYLLKKSPTTTIFEGTVIEDGVLVMVDVIDKINNNSFDFYEIKLNLELNDVIWNDLAIQYHVIKKRYGDKINTFNIVLRKNTQDFVILNVQDALEEKNDGIEEIIIGYKKVLSGSEPKIEIGNQCHSPYDCEFIDYCKGQNTNWINHLIPK